MSEARSEAYNAVRRTIDSLLEGETDWVAAMATATAELHHAFNHYHWTGFYRSTGREELKIGPYQGGHGCLTIDFSRGVCGAAARTQQTQLVDDVHNFPGHIACSSSTRSEIVVPIVSPEGRLLGVLDVDSNDPAAFNEADRQCLESLCAWLGEVYGETHLL